MTPRLPIGALVLALPALLCSCAPGMTLKTASFHDAAALRTEASDWRGARTGVTYLRRAYEVQVGVATAPVRATSHLRAHVVRIAWDTEKPLVWSIATPAIANLISVKARVLGAGSATPVEPTSRGSSPKAGLPDPGQVSWSLTFAPVRAGEALEVIADFEIPWTLTDDARWLGAPDGPTAQLLIRYDVPTNANATMQIRGADASPLVTRQDGHQVFAVFLRDVPARRDDGAHVRYVTRSASVRGYDQRFASSWAQVSGPYEAALVQDSAALRMHHREPYRVRETGAAGAREAALWVRDRLQRDDALDARWADGRPLPNLLTSNDLHATDKVHLLRWILDAAGIEHRVAAVRSRGFAPMDPTLPFPGAFDGAAVYLPQGDLWLDPACASCEPGEVREAYRGALGLLLPAGPGAVPVRLPE